MRSHLNPRWIRRLRRLNVVAALVLGVTALARLVQQGSAVGVVLFCGLMVVGPLEDWLRRRTRLAPELVDQATSLGLIVALIAAALLAR